MVIVHKKGVSQIVATVLLIALGVSLAYAGMVFGKDLAEKFGKKTKNISVQEYCSDVSVNIDGCGSGGEYHLNITNTGNYNITYLGLQYKVGEADKKEVGLMPGNFTTIYIATGEVTEGQISIFPFIFIEDEEIGCNKQSIKVGELNAC